MWKYPSSSWMTYVAGVLALGAFLAKPSLEAGTLSVTPDAAASGSLGLEVALNVPCSVGDIELPQGPISGDFLACETITAGDSQVVSPGAVLTAGTQILIESQFAVTTGSLRSFVNPGVASEFAYVEDQRPASTVSYSAHFYLNLDPLTLDSADRIEHLNGYSSDGAVWFKVSLIHNDDPDENRLVLSARRDNGTYAETPFGEEVMLPPGFHTIKVEWRAGLGNGHFMISVDSAPFGGLEGLDNDTGRIDFIRWGAVDGTVGSTSGSLYQDGFVSSY